MDLSNLSDDELRKMAGRQETSRRSVADMSDDELRAMTGQSSEPMGPSMADRNKLVRSQFDALPWYAKAGQAVDDTVRLAANGATLGFVDKLAGMASGNVAAERLATEDARTRSGSAGMVAEIGGGGGTGLGAASAGLTGARFIPQGMTGGKRLAALMGAGAVDGAAMGALSGAGNTDDGNYAGRMAKGAAVGGLIGAFAPAVVAGTGKAVGGIIDKFRAKPEVPTTQGLRAASQQAYKAAEDAGDVIPQSSMAALRDRVQNTFTNEGFHPGLQPRAGVVMSELDRLADQNVTLKGLEVARRMAGKAYDPMNKDSNRLAAMARNEIDDLASTTQGGPALEQARALYARTAKSDALEQAIAKAQQRTASTGSGGNIDNATRQEVRKMAERHRGLTPDEKEAAALVVQGSKGQNLARLIGKLSPEGNGLSAMMHGAGVLASGGMSLPLMAVGAVAKRSADKSSAKNVEALRRLILSGGDASALQLAPSTPQRFITDNREALARALGLTGIGAMSGAQ